MTRSGCEHPLAKAVTESEEVLVARTCSLGNDGFKRSKQRCFCGQVFHYGFHNGIALGQGLQVCGPVDPCFDFLSKCLGQTFFLHQPSKHL